MSGNRRTSPIAFSFPLKRSAKVREQFIPRNEKKWTVAGPIAFWAVPQVASCPGRSTTELEPLIDRQPFIDTPRTRIRIYTEPPTFYRCFQPPYPASSLVSGRRQPQPINIHSDCMAAAFHQSQFQTSIRGAPTPSIKLLPLQICQRSICFQTAPVQSTYFRTSVQCYLFPKVGSTIGYRERIRNSRFHRQSNPDSNRQFSVQSHVVWDF